MALVSFRLDVTMMFTDPKRNVVKHLRITYRNDGGEVRHVRFNENERILLPR